MGNNSGMSPLNPNKYLGPNVYLNIIVSRNRQPTGADYRQPETGLLYQVNTLWQVDKSPTTGVEGQIFTLTKIVANVAYWSQIASSTSKIVYTNVTYAMSPYTVLITDDYISVDSLGGAVTLNLADSTLLLKDRNGI